MAALLPELTRKQQFIGHLEDTSLAETFVPASSLPAASPAGIIIPQLC
jgi:hypothetical protein